MTGHEIFERNGIQIHFGGHDNEQLEELASYYEKVVTENAEIAEFIKNVIRKRKEENDRTMA